MLCSLSGARGTPEAGVSHGGYPCRLVNGPHVCQGPRSWWVGSSRDPSLSMKGWLAPFPLGLAPKKVHYSPTATTSVVPKEEEATMQVVSLTKGPSETINGPLGTSQLLAILQGDLPSPGLSLYSHFPLDPSSKSTWRVLAKCTSASAMKSIPPTGILWCPTAFRSILRSV